MTPTLQQKLLPQKAALLQKSQSMFLIQLQLVSITSTVCSIFFINKVTPLISTKQPVAVKSSPLECTASDSTATGTFAHVMQKTL